MPRFPKKITYCQKVEDDKFYFRNVVLDEATYRRMVPDRIMTVPEWRALGIKGTEGWEHYHIYPFEPNVIMLRKPKDTLLDNPLKEQMIPNFASGQQLQGSQGLKQGTELLKQEDLRCQYGNFEKQAKTDDINEVKPMDCHSWESVSEKRSRSLFKVYMIGRNLGKPLSTSKEKEMSPSCLTSGSNIPGSKLKTVSSKYEQGKLQFGMKKPHPNTQDKQNSTSTVKPQSKKQPLRSCSPITSFKFLVGKLKWRKQD